VFSEQDIFRLDIAVDTVVVVTEIDRQTQLVDNLFGEFVVDSVE
jgi:hypothetical protein